VTGQGAAMPVFRTFEASEVAGPGRWPKPSDDGCGCGCLLGCGDFFVASGLEPVTAAIPFAHCARTVSGLFNVGSGSQVPCRPW
jgi:hypothetical protein